MSKPRPYERKKILSYCDGPEGIEIYTCHDRAVSDWAAHDALYLDVSIQGAMVTMGPFQLLTKRGLEQSLLKCLPKPTKS